MQIRWVLIQQGKETEIGRYVLGEAPRRTGAPVRETYFTDIGLCVQPKQASYELGGAVGTLGFTQGGAERKTLETNLPCRTLLRGTIPVDRERVVFVASERPLSETGDTLTDAGIQGKRGVHLVARAKVAALYVDFHSARSQSPVAQPSAELQRRGVASLEPTRYDKAITLGQPK